MEAIILLMGSNRGIYIPRDFVLECLSCGVSGGVWSGFDSRDAETLKNPENAGYWEAWDSILSDCVFTSKEGEVFTLYQDGDLWALCLERMTNEEKENFGFETEDE